ncbi:MAG: tetratricopeptide repeat protein [candidate division Zixibacteria bacterium]|nr:tetratricopeptide repeat protein [candidate division Zixibacteria bacterium]
MKLRYLLVFFLLILQAVACQAVEDSEIWAKANSDYDSGEFGQAIEGYMSMLERGLRTPVVYYNLGNSYFKQNQVGMAIAAFHHSLKLDPSFTHARENLEYVRQFAIDKVEERPKGFLLNIWYGLAGLLSSEGHFLFSMITFWGLSSIITLLILGIGKKEFLTYLLILLIILFILWVTLTYNVVDKEVNTKWGVVTVTSAELREGPGEDFEKIFTGHEGLEFKILSQRQEYYLIELKNGLRGWIQSNLLMEI